MEHDLLTTIDAGRPEATALAWQFVAILEEYKSLLAEKLDVMKRQQQLLLYTFLLSGGAIPAIFTLLSSAKVELLTALLAGLSFLFSSLLLAHLGYTKGVWDIARYINTHLSPRANELIESVGQAPPQYPVLWWEGYGRVQRKTTQGEFFLMSLLGIGEVPLLVLPGLGSLAMLFYLTYTSPVHWLRIHYYLMYGLAVFFIVSFLSLILYGISLSRDEPGIQSLDMK